MLGCRDTPVRIALDYRPALRERTGVGEYVHALARALVSSGIGEDEIILFTSSWKDRPSPAALAEVAPMQVADRRVPVRLLAAAWNKLGWPPIEWLGVEADVVHTQVPMWVPSRRAARVVTVHDLDFLTRPDTAGRVRRTAALDTIRAQVAAADHVITSSVYGRQLVETRLGVEPTRVSVCSPGPPTWAADVRSRRGGFAGDQGHILFVGTLGDRKNISGLLHAYLALVERSSSAPRLVLAGRVPQSQAHWRVWVHAVGLGDRVEFRGYVPDEERAGLYEGARMLVLPSWDEGFGMPVLEAMACGVPVVVSNRGSLPEVAGPSAQPVEPDDIAGLCARMQALLDPQAAAAASAAGVREAERYSWAACAAAARDAYRAAIERRVRR